jgi:hypothetical protein
MTGFPTENLEHLFEPANLAALKDLFAGLAAQDAANDEAWQQEHANKRPACMLGEREADQVVNHILHLREERARVKALAEARVRQLEQEERRLLWMWKPALEAFALAKRGNRKSVILPSGILSHRTIKALVEVVDKNAVIAWAVEYHPDEKMLVQKFDIVKAELDLYIARTGELPPGTDRRNGYEKFSIDGAQ